MGNRGRWALAAIALVIQLAVLYAPRTPTVETGLPLDKVAHVVVFAVPVVALVAAGLPRRWVVMGMALHALLSEVLQAAVLPQRSGDPADVVADLVGVAIGAWLARGRAGPFAATPRP